MSTNSKKYTLTNNNTTQTDMTGGNFHINPIGVFPAFPTLIPSKVRAVMPYQTYGLPGYMIGPEINLNHNTISKKYININAPGISVRLSLKDIKDQDLKDLANVISELVRNK